MKNKNLLLMAFFVAAQIITAQTADIKLGVEVGIIKNEYNGDYGNGIFNFKQQMYPSLGVAIGYYLNPSFNVGLRSAFGDYGYRENNVNYFRGRKTDVSLYTQYKFNNGYILKESSRLTPFLTIGLGIAAYGINSDLDKSGSNPSLYPTIVTKGVDFILPVGAGLKYQITERVAVQYQYLYNFTSSDIRDENRGPNFFGSTSHPSSKSGNDAFGQHVFSVVFNIGKHTDTDKDGVGDRYDKCPNTPRNVKVDMDGCPIDSDKDGVADYLDQCLDTPAGVLVDTKGCPVDADLDGVPDYLDKCANTPSGIKVDATGCPIDTDGDGIADYLDKCPDTPKDVKVDVNGCAIDTDGDGIPDYLDKCPDVAGIAANNGCPEVLTTVFQNIEFEFASDKLTRESYPTLDQIAITLNNNSSTVKINIAGYTDYIGTDEYNLKLSVKRANSVKVYLLSKKVPGSRIVITGYGEENPIAPNESVEGRQKNRRVEFQITK
ncbi:MAG: OmpA family protein [Paludibacter sp.]|nr:OmpA family protein [Paludibacter sp.]